MSSDDGRAIELDPKITASRRTLLATGGLLLIMQQPFRFIFDAREVGVEPPDWIMGSLPVTDTIEVQINGLFVMGLTTLIAVAFYLLMLRSRWGLQVGAVVLSRPRAGAVGISTKKIGPLHLRPQLRHRRHRQERLHHDPLHQPNRRLALHCRHLSGGRVRTSSQFAAKAHAPGCGCCKAGMESRRRILPGGAKSFPSARPWMISH